MNGVCALYKIEAKLKKSHIIPKFVFDYLKVTGSKYLRGFENPDKRLQDGPTAFLLSEKAEQEFSRRERWFANNIFYPLFKEKKESFPYDENMAYFMISVLWRVLVEQRKHAAISNNPAYNFLSEPEEEWRQFLANFTFPRNYSDLNIWFTDRVKSHNTSGINVDLYFTRYIDATIVSNEKKTTVVVYVKFLRFIIWSVVKGSINDSPDLKINFAKGEVKIPQKLNDNFMGSFFQNRIEEIDKRPRPSQEQQELIKKQIFENEKSFWSTDAADSMRNDFNLKK